MKSLFIAQAIFVGTLISASATAQEFESFTPQFEVNKSNIKPSGSSAAAQRQRTAKQAANRANHGAKKPRK